MATAVQAAAGVPSNSGNRQLLKSASQVYRENYVIYVSNLVYTINESSLEEAFSQEGLDVKHVELLKKGIGASRTGAGLAVVTMTTSEDKQKALQVMDGKFLFGRPMVLRTDKFV